MRSPLAGERKSVASTSNCETVGPSGASARDWRRQASRYVRAGDTQNRVESGARPLLDSSRIPVL
jgi:hypothetical protein